MNWNRAAREKPPCHLTAPETGASDGRDAPIGNFRDERAVHLRFPGEQKRRLRRNEPLTCAGGEPIWTERPLLLQRVDGSFDLIGSSDNLGGLARWILSFATDVRAVSPPVLRQNVHDLASAVVDLCESGGLDGPA